MKFFFKRSRNKVVIIFLLLGLIVGGVVVFNFFNNEYALTVEERQWLDNNINSAHNVNVVNNASVFGNYGEGVFYDFLNSFSDEYTLSINPITHDYDSEKTGLSLGIKTELADEDVVIYEDTFVLLGKNDVMISQVSDLTELSIGIESRYVDLLVSELDEEPDFITFDNKELLLEAFDGTGTGADEEEIVLIDYIVVPLNLYLTDILVNNYSVLYHLSDINYYFVLSTDDSLLSSILEKYYFETWSVELNNSYKENQFNTFVESLDIKETDIASTRSIIYNYGFVESAPYEIIGAGEFGGISASVLKEFSEFSKVEFSFEGYSSTKKLFEGIENKSIDIYIDNYNFESEYKTTSNIVNVRYSVIASKTDDLVVNSVNSLKGKDVYVLSNSLMYDFINKKKGINVLTYDDESELSKLNKEEVIIILDSNSFSYYNKNILSNYTNRYSDETDYVITYEIKSDNTLFLLLDKYIEVTDTNSLVNEGYNNYIETVKAGNLLSTLARYALFLLLGLAIALFIIIRKTKKIQIARKIKREDKMKFIDQLTSLKNRNYLNECTEKWDNNTIYPQAIIIADLNGIQMLNDKHGYNEGDRQIKSFANVLMKTQLDNSEIMRTDGNEFVIYLIGYNQKQITNYIYKLNKEVEKLPYENGVKFGYSMILDNLKSIEDCLNEASNDMKDKRVK